MKKLHFLLVVLIVSLSVFAQKADRDDMPIPYIRVKVGVQKGQIKLRWAIDEAIAWQKANKIGFTVKRYTYMRNGQLLPESELANLGIFLPQPEQDWMSVVETNDNAAIVAQSLFGESFEVEMGETPASGIEAIINKSEELEQRFAYALMAADFDFEVAQLAGWAFVDKDVKPGDKYVYIVELNAANNTNNLLVEKGQAMASIDEWKELPAPVDFIAIFQDKTVTLAWEYQQLKDVYTSYFIEKSENKTNFSPISDLPVVNMNNKDDKQMQGMVYIDTLAQNDKTFYYRIRGKTIFGEYGPYSNIVSGIGMKNLDSAPRINFFDIAQDESIRLDWEFPQSSEKDIVSFKLLYSETDEKNSYKILKNNIAIKDRSVITKSQSPSNYFKIKAVGKNNDAKESFAVLVQPNDTIPPTIPIELTGRIDSTGVARLSWKPNTEKDFAGYHVFRGIQQGEELVRLTPEAIEMPHYADTVQLQSLNSKVYYYVTAIDMRNNQSEASIILELEKPDMVKPEAPVFIDYRTDDGTIQLRWTKSYSDDVTVHRLFRMEADGKQQSGGQIYETTDIKSEYTFTDRNVKPGHKYRYYLRAQDRNGLFSEKSQEITIQCLDLRPADVFSNLTNIVNRKENKIELNWRVNPDEEVSEITIYRQKEDGKASLWGTLSGAQNFLEDKDVQVGTQYTYLLKAILKNGRPSSTKKITVEY